MIVSLMNEKIQFFGILNITPDSFSDGGKYINAQRAITHAEQLSSDGADFIDVGGESTKPNAEEILCEVEWERISEVIKVLVNKYPGKISLDTKNWQTAEKFLKIGGTVLNDVSGFQDPQMVDLAVKFQPLIVVNHFPGKTTDEVHRQKINSLDQVLDELLERKESLIRDGVSSKNIILDPGIGFGKSMELNWKLLKFAKYVPEERVMIGHSRKRFLGDNRFEVNQNLKAAKIAIDAGTSFLRVHKIV